MRLRRVLVCAVAAVVSAGCGSSGARSPHSSVKSPAARAQSLRYQDNGRTVSARVGGVIRVKLDSTYWTIDGSSDARVLAAAGPVQHVGAPRSRSCVPGQGCGSVSQSFLATVRGRAVVSAHRTICGEAMACRPDQRTFSVTVVVS